MIGMAGTKATNQVRMMSPLGKYESHPLLGGSHRLWERETIWS